MDNKQDLPQNQPRWEREEQVLLVVEYFSSKGNQEALDKSCSLISNVLRQRGKALGLDITEKYRNVNGIQRQMENLKHFDTDNSKEINGHESSWMLKIMNEYIKDPLGLTTEAYEVMKKYMLNY